MHWDWNASRSRLWYASSAARNAVGLAAARAAWSSDTAGVATVTSVATVVARVAGAVAGVAAGSGLLQPTSARAKVRVKMTAGIAGCRRPGAKRAVDCRMMNLFDAGNGSGAPV